MIKVTPQITIADSEIVLDFIRASGPGGQNVNKVATAVQLRFDAENSPSLSRDMRDRLRRLAGRRMTADGVLVINARRFRSQARNRQDVLDRLVKLIRAAVQPPKKRIGTQPSRASRARQLSQKRRRSRTKKLRSRVSPSDDF